MGNALEWLAEVGSGLYALTASLVVLGGFVVLLVEMIGKAAGERKQRPVVNIYINEVHVHVGERDEPSLEAIDQPALPPAREDEPS